MFLHVYFLISDNPLPLPSALAQPPFPGQTGAPSSPCLIRVSEGEWGWVRVSEGEWGWVKGGASEPTWDCVSRRECEGKSQGLQCHWEEVREVEGGEGWVRVRLSQMLYKSQYTQKLSRVICYLCGIEPTF